MATQKQIEAARLAQPAVGDSETLGAIIDAAAKAEPAFGTDADRELVERAERMSRCISGAAPVADELLELAKRALSTLAQSTDANPAGGVVTDDSADACRYRRLQVLGCAPSTSRQLESGTVLCFSNLDAFVDADLAAHPSRGEAQRAGKAAAPVEWSQEHIDSAEYVLRHYVRQYGYTLTDDRLRGLGTVVLGAVAPIRDGERVRNVLLQAVERHKQARAAAPVDLVERLEEDLRSAEDALAHYCEDVCEWNSDDRQKALDAFATRPHKPTWRGDVDRALDAVQHRLREAYESGRASLTQDIRRERTRADQRRVALLSVLESRYCIEGDYTQDGVHPVLAAMRRLQEAAATTVAAAPVKRTAAELGAFLENAQFAKDATVMAQWTAALDELVALAERNAEVGRRAERNKVANELELLADLNTVGGFELMHSDVRRMIARLRKESSDG